MKKKHSWERPFIKKGVRESNEHFELFLQYKNMGPNRSIRKLYELRKQQGMIKPTLNVLYKYSSKYEWNKRIQDMLEWQARKATEKNLEQYLTNYEQGIQRTLNMNNLLNRLQEVLNSSVAMLNPEDKDSLTFFQVVSYLFVRISSFHNKDIYDVGGLVTLIDKVVQEQEAFKQHHNEYTTGDEFVSAQIKLIEEAFDKYVE